MTATRLVTGGVLFGRGKKNMGGRTLWLKVEGPDFEWIVDGQLTKGIGADAANKDIEKKARKFAAAVNTAARSG